jgi:hypothetical protein
MVEPRIRGEPGYGDWSIHLFEMGVCSCGECGGHLVDGMCISCGCRHGIHEPSRFHRQRFARWRPVPEPGRCSHADALRTEEEREQDRRTRTLWRRSWAIRGGEAEQRSAIGEAGGVEPRVPMPAIYLRRSWTMTETSWHAA